jgi:hypothetical protein
MTALLNSVPRDPLRLGQDPVVFETRTAAPRVWTLDAEGDQIAGALRLGSGELMDLSLHLLNAWQSEIGFSKASTPLQSTVEQAMPGAATLRLVVAAAGNYVLHELIDAIEEPMATTFAELVENHLRKAGEDRRPLVFMSDVMFPWRMLYACPGDISSRVDDDADPEVVDDRGFLGIAGIVDHMMAITKPAERNRGTSVPVGIHSGLTGGPGGSSDLRSALGQRADLEPRFVDDEADFARAIAADRSALIYAYCHGQFRHATAGQPLQELVLRKKPLTGRDVQQRIKNKTGVLSTSPIAVVNACQGGVFKAEYSTTVIDALRRCGASGTVGPLLDIPICFGGVFGTKLLQSLMEGDSLSGALLAVTRRFMTEDRNPLGLAYQSINGRNAVLPSRSES